MIGRLCSIVHGSAVLSLLAAPTRLYFQNMMFDNSPQPKPPVRDVIRSHLPLFLVVGGAAALFVSLHTAATAVAVAAAGHVVLGSAIALVGYLRTRARTGTGTTAGVGAERGERS